MNYFINSPSMLMQWSTSSSLPIWSRGALAAPGTPQLSARLPWGLCQGPGAACAVMPACGVPAGSSGCASGNKLCPGFFSNVVFSLKSYVVWRPCPCKTKGILFSTGCTTFFSFQLQQRQGVQLGSKSVLVGAGGDEQCAVLLPWFSWVCSCVVWKMYYACCC